MKPPLSLVVLLISFLSLIVPRPTASDGAEPGVARRVVVQPAKFGYVPAGWSVSDDDFEFLTRSGATADSYALSWRYKPNPFGWASNIPTNGIAVSVFLIRRASGRDRSVNLCQDTPHLAHSPRFRRLPLQIPMTTSHRLEGASDVRFYRVLGRMGELYNVELHVAIKSLRPSPALLRRAQLVVSRIQFPQWPRRRRC